METDIFQVIQEVEKPQGLTGLLLIFYYLWCGAVGLLVATRFLPWFIDRKGWGKVESIAICLCLVILFDSLCYLFLVSVSK